MEGGHISFKTSHLPPADSVSDLPPYNAQEFKDCIIPPLRCQCQTLLDAALDVSGVHYRTSLGIGTGQLTPVTLIDVFNGQVVASAGEMFIFISLKVTARSPYPPPPNAMKCPVEIHHVW